MPKPSILNPPPGANPPGYIGDDLAATNKRLRRIIYGDEPKRQRKATSRRPHGIVTKSERRRETSAVTSPANPQETNNLGLAAESTVMEPSTPPPGRIIGGASPDDVLRAYDTAMASGPETGVAFTVSSRRILPLADDAEVARHHGALGSHLRDVIRRCGLPHAFILRSLEKCERFGLHGHFYAQCPAAFMDHVLDRVESLLVRINKGRLPPGTFCRGSRHHRFCRQQGRIVSAAQGLGWVKYLLKSAVWFDGEHGIRKGKGLKPVAGIAIHYGCGRRPNKGAVQAADAVVDAASTNLSLLPSMAPVRLSYALRPSLLGQRRIAARCAVRRGAGRIMEARHVG